MPTVQKRFRGLTEAQETVFGRIACGWPPYPCADRTLRALLDKGLIDATEHAEAHPLGVFVHSTYEVPISVHMEWCAFCVEACAGEAESP